MNTKDFAKNSTKIILGFILGISVVFGSATFATFSITNKPLSVTADTPLLTLANWNSISSAFTQVEEYLNRGIEIADAGVTIKKDETVQGNEHITKDLQVDGNSNLNGNLTVLGTTNFKNTTVQGNLTITGGLIIPVGNPVNPVNGQMWIDPTVALQ
ncbi:MAG: hypothetical protein WCJ84_01790 [Candidatus Peregrinibacteria bacterium]